MLAACVCPAGGSGPGLCSLLRWGMAGAEWEGRVGQGCESACYRVLRPVTTEGKKHTDRVFFLPSFEDAFKYKYTWIISERTAEIVATK